MANDEVMGPPAPVEFAMPIVWAGVLMWCVALVIGLLLVAVLTIAAFERAGARASLFLLLVAPLAWLGSRVVGSVREPRVFRFEADGVEVPKLSVFGRRHRIAYDDIERLGCYKVLRVDFTKGASVAVSIQDHWQQIVAAMQLRLGCSLDRRGRHVEAIAMYEDASPEHEPPLDARIAFARWHLERQREPDVQAPPDSGEEGANETARVERALRLDALGEILTCLVQAACDHREVFGAEHACTRFLHGAVERFRAEYPGVVVDESLGSPETQRAERLADRSGDPPLQDRWMPVEEGAIARAP